MRLLVPAVLVLTLHGCGTEVPPRAAEPSISAAPASSAPGLDLPVAADPDDWSGSNVPRFQVMTDDGQQLEVPAWTFCGAGLCIDGVPGPDPPPIGSPDELIFGFDRPGWDFDDVTFVERVEECPRRITVAAEHTGPRTFRVEPAGPAGDWNVEMSGRGPEGDAVTTIRWRTPHDGALPVEATGHVGVLADEDGALTSYGVEIMVEDLAARAKRADATVTVRSAAGRGVRIPAKRDPGCYSAGTLTFRAANGAGLAATRLGTGPFDYRVDLDLDGTSYVGRATWPRDEIKDFAPYAALTWTPPLPVYAG